MNYTDGCLEFYALSYAQLRWFSKGFKDFPSWVIFIYYSSAWWPWLTHLLFYICQVEEINCRRTILWHSQNTWLHCKTFWFWDRKQENAKMDCSGWNSKKIQEIQKMEPCLWYTNLRSRNLFWWFYEESMLSCEVQGVQEKLCFFSQFTATLLTSLQNPQQLLNLQNSQHNASVQSLLLAGNFVQPIAAEGEASNFREFLEKKHNF